MLLCSRSNTFSTMTTGTRKTIHNPSDMFASPPTLCMAWFLAGFFASFFARR